LKRTRGVGLSRRRKSPKLRATTTSAKKMSVDSSDDEDEISQS